MVSTTDLKVYKTTNFLGGAITGTEVNLSTPNNCFTNVPVNELVTGKDYYACVYLKDAHATESMDNFKLWLNTKSLPADTEIKWGFDPSATAQTIPDKYTAPIGVTWNVLGPEPTNPNKGKVNALSSFPIWLWYHVSANAASRLDDNEIFTFKFDIPPGGTGSGGGGSGGSGGGTGGNPPPVIVDYKVAIVGDEGCGSITTNVKNKMSTYDFIVSVGDHAYASASCWTSTFNSVKTKMNSAYGNHEYSESGGISPYKTFFGHSTTYNTFKFQNIQFFIIDTNINGDPGSAQNTFITNALAASQLDNTIVWRIGIYHHPSYGSSSSHAYNTASTRENWHTKFQNSGVRIVCTGHNHNWQRTDMIAFNSGSPSNPTVVDSTSPYSNSSIGYIHVVTGTGGHDSASNLYGLSTQPSYQHYQNNTHNGFWEIVATNGGNTLTCSFVEVGGAKFDTFVINNP